MHARRIGLAITLLLANALILGGLACGKKSTPMGPAPPNDPGDPAPFAEGTWELHYTLTTTGGDPTCSSADGSGVDTFAVVNGELEGFLTSTCTFAVNGSHFVQACRDTYAISALCRFVIAITGSGDVSGDTFTASYTGTVTPLGNCSLAVPTCSFTITATGNRIPAIATGVRVRSVPEGIDRLALGRILARLGRAATRR